MSVDVILKDRSGTDITYTVDSTIALPLSGGGHQLFYLSDYRIAMRGIVDRSITAVTAEDLAGITSVGDCAFYACNSLTSLELPDTVTQIGERAFFGCHMPTLTVPDSVTTIGDQAFGFCTYLRALTLGSGVTSIGDRAWAFTMLESLTVKAASPPTLNANTLAVLPERIPIYVPAASVQAYKTDSIWNARSAYIQAIQ